MPVAKKNEIKIGKASIKSSISGVSKLYDINITKINYDTYDGLKGIEIKVTDSELLGYTNGIVQGMSGSPIIQNGKVVGAITHVLVNDPTRGYGIFIENMLEHWVRAVGREKDFWKGYFHFMKSFFDIKNEISQII